MVLDLARMPVLGRFLRWKYARSALQLFTGVLAVILIYDGLYGPQVASMNLAGIVPWIHWRGLVIMSLLLAGNVSCMVCPFTLPRTLTRAWFGGGFPWPDRLKNKWLALCLLALFLWAYEAYSLWDSPAATAWIIVAYFIAAFVVDVLFRGGTFCKYVCPIGQFNFVQSLLSPFQVSVRARGVCATCQTHDCIRGRDHIAGCEMNLFQPRKSSNMDCTFCLDCVHACPHENVGILAGWPGKDLWDDPFRSGIGRFGKRPDLAVLALVVVFGAFVNAAGMVGPVVRWQKGVQSVLVDHSPVLALSLYFGIFLGVLPALATFLVAVVSRWWGQLRGGWLAVGTRFSYALVPLGLGMWFSHYSFHFFGSFPAVLPALQRFLLDLGWFSVGDPEWALSCCRPVADWLPRFEIVCLDIGLLTSLYAAYRIAVAESSAGRFALKAFLPWAVLIVLLFAVGVWIVLQPMQMRGMMAGA
jgi:ferredoxin